MAFIKFNLRNVILLYLLFFILSCQWNPNQDIVDVDSSTWMNKLDDRVTLTSLAIPGSHDTCAIYDFLIATTSAAQDIPLYEQLDRGVRFLDIRISKQKDGTLGIYHGIKYMYIDFEDVVNICIDFLKNNPSEFILMMVKEEVFRSSGSGKSFTDDLYKIISENASYWANPKEWEEHKSYPYPNDISYLRGKILLFRDYTESSLGTTPSINIYNGNRYYWERKGDSAAVPSGNIKTIEDKWQQVNDYIDNRSIKNDDGKLYLHSVAAYNSLTFELPNIDNVAKSINPRLIKKLKEENLLLTKKPLGILMCDKVNPSLITSIYSLNF